MQSEHMAYGYVSLPKITGRLSSKVKMASYQQDLPPKSGFEKVEWAARGPKRFFGGFTQFSLFIAFTVTAWVWHKFDKAKKRSIKLEMTDARIAIEPFIFAEKDRAILKHYRRSRDEENELMKNVEGWKTGTLYGEPVYYNVRDRYVKPSLKELLTHMSPDEQFDFVWHKNKLYASK